jgi:hypothetical protein
VRLAARTEGLLCTGKAMDGLIARRSDLTPAVFLHTGSWPVLFARAEKL